MSIQSPGLITILKHEAKQFCLNTALHGYKFIVLPKRILLERVFWAITVLLSLGVALYLLYLAWTNFEQNPTILVTHSTHFPIWSYPFPAVTICSFSQISRKQLLYFIKRNLTKFDGFTQHELFEQMKLVAQLVNYNNHDIPQVNFTRLQNVLNINNIKIDELLKQLSEPCTSMLKRCKWKGEEKTCDSLFEKIATSDGYCCSFNYFALKNHLFKGSRLPPTKPQRVSACGYSTGLEVLVESTPNDYYATLISSVGQKVLLHNSLYLPDWNVQIMLTEEKIINLIGITPTITQSTDNIKKLDISRRKCIFSSEQVLGNFQSNFHNCLAECRMNLTVQKCGCIPFFYSNSEGTYPPTRICNLNDLQCLRLQKNLIHSSIPGFDIQSVTNLMNIDMSHSTCNCWPDCDYVDYLAEASFGLLTRKYAINQVSLYGHIQITNHSVIRVYFNDLVATKNRRNVSFSWHTLLAYYGGLLGLFIGFSFVSGVELIYFFTIKLIADAAKKKTSNSNKKNVVKVKPTDYEDLNARKLGLKFGHFEVRRRSNSNQ